MDKDRLLAGPDDELGAVFDFVLIAGKSPHERAVRVVHPFDDVDEFAAKLVEKSHRTLLPIHVFAV
jgi:hypothetical protein